MLSVAVWCRPRSSGARDIRGPSSFLSRQPPVRHRRSTSPLSSRSLTRAGEREGPAALIRERRVTRPGAGKPAPGTCLRLFSRLCNARCFKRPPCNLYMAAEGPIIRIDSCRPQAYFRRFLIARSSSRLSSFFLIDSRRSNCFFDLASAISHLTKPCLK